MCSRNLWNLENANLVSEAQHVSNSLRVTQEREQKEVEEQIGEEGRCLDDSKASYQNLSNDLQ